MSQTVRTIFSRRMAIVFFLGISSGIPLLAIGGTLQAWMTDMGVNLATIGLFALVGLPYTYKFIWAPFMDRFQPLPFLDRRRGWMLISQIALALTLAALGVFDPDQAPLTVAVLAFLIAFFSASQDIVIDAYRREILADCELGLGTSMAINGYRIGMLISGALALFLADHMAWQTVYQIIGLTMGIGVAATLLAPTADVGASLPRSLREAVVHPFVDFFKRSGAIEVLFFVLLYKIGDQMASAMTTPFILSLGFTKTDMATIAKTFGLLATLGGAFTGGVILLRIGMKRALWLFGVLQALPILGFSFLAYVGQNYPVLVTAVVSENFAAGLGSAAYVAFMASLTNRKFTATQYALLSSLIGIPRVLLAAPTGAVAEFLGWQNYFLFCTLMAVPGLVLLTRFHHWQNPRCIPEELEAQVETPATA